MFSLKHTIITMLVVCATGLTWTAGASADTTAFVAGGTLSVADDTVGGAPLTVTCDAGDVRVNGAAVGAGAACGSITSIVIDSAFTSGATSNAIELAGAGPADGYTALESTQITAGYKDTVSGSPVRDVITGPYETLAIQGGAGDDEIFAGSATSVDGGPGDDRIRDPNRTGKATGGEGTDTAVFDYSDRGPIEFDASIANGRFSIAAGSATAEFAFASIEVVDARLPGGRQRVDGSAFTGALRIDAGAGDDEVVGGPGADELFGGAGADTLDGAAGEDVLTGDGGAGAPGADTIAAREGERDVVDCGAGNSVDSVVGDRIDSIAECETVDLPPLPTGPGPGLDQGPGSVADRDAPVVRIRRASLRKSRLAFVVTCPVEESRCVGEARLRASGRRGGKPIRAALGRVAIDLPGGRSQKVLKRLSRPQRRRVTGLRRARLGVRLEVRDAAGNRTIQAARLPLSIKVI